MESSTTRPCLKESQRRDSKASIVVVVKKRNRSAQGYKVSLDHVNIPVQNIPTSSTTTAAFLSDDCGSNLSRRAPKPTMPCTDRTQDFRQVVEERSRDIPDNKRRKLDHPKSPSINPETSGGAPAGKEYINEAYTVVRTKLDCARPANCSSHTALATSS